MATSTTTKPKKSPAVQVITAFLAGLPTGFKIRPQVINQPGGNRRVLTIVAERRTPPTVVSNRYQPSIWTKDTPRSAAPKKKFNPGAGPQPKTGIKKRKTVK